MNRKLEFKIVKHVNQIIPFDINKIFDVGDVVIFGGAIRDSLANLNINDIDIIALPKSAKALHHFLTKQNYCPIGKDEPIRTPMKDPDPDKKYEAIWNDDKWEKENEKIIDHWIMEKFQVDYNIKWFNVITYFYKKRKSKFNFIADEKFKRVPIQLILPSIGHFAQHYKIKSCDTITQQFLERIKKFIVCNVDISCCGVSLDGDGLHEMVPNAISDCLNKKCAVFSSSEFYDPKRTGDRVKKLKDRGWTVYENDPFTNKRRMWKPMENIKPTANPLW